MAQQTGDGKSPGFERLQALNHAGMYVRMHVTTSICLYTYVYVFIYVYYVHIYT